MKSLMEIEEVLPLEKESNQAEELGQKIPTMRAADIQPASYVSPPKRWRFFRERYDKFWCYRSEINELFDRLFPERETLVMYRYASGFSGHVFIKKPNERHPYYVLFTAGMSHVPMNVPKGLKGRRASLERAELIMFLSLRFSLKGLRDVDFPNSFFGNHLAHSVPWKDNWFTKLDQRYERLRCGRYYDIIWDYPTLWPIAWLEKLARMPYKNHTWIYHRLMVRDVGSVNTWQASGIFLNFGQLAARNGQTINLYSCVPLYPEEVDYLHPQQQPLDEPEQQAANERFLRDLPLVVDLKRPPFCPPEAKSKL